MRTRALMKVQIVRILKARFPKGNPTPNEIDSWCRRAAGIVVIALERETQIVWPTETKPIQSDQVKTETKPEEAQE
jgi:hypothetical protein